MKSRKIKLPRKRKKRFIKALGRISYLSAQLMGEILRDEGKKDAHKFPVLLFRNKRVLIVGYW